MVAAVFGLVSSLAVALTGDMSARTISKVQPVKFAAMEALYEGRTEAPLTAISILSAGEEKLGEKNIYDHKLQIEVPNLLSMMTTGDKGGYVPGLKDLINGNAERGILSVEEMIERGKYARQVLTDYRMAKELGDSASVAALGARFSDSEFTDELLQVFRIQLF